VKEETGPPRGPFDSLQSFQEAKGLTDEDYNQLKDLCHKDLAYVLREYDGDRLIEDLVSEASVEDPEEVPAADKPGVYVMGRSMRLELIDPFADALVCGDANLTFSLVLAQHRKALGHTGRTVATTFEKLDTLRERYGEIDLTVEKLESLGCEVVHDVDGTRLKVDDRFKDREEKFGAAYYNFPHAGVVQGFFDGHPFVRWRHANLMILFFRALCSVMKPGGLVKIASNSNATGVRYSDILEAAQTSEFVHVETVPFLDWVLHNYRRSYGDRRDENRRPEDGENYKNQRAQGDMVYCFKYSPSGGPPPKPQIRFPPKKETLMLANEGKLGNLSGKEKEECVHEVYQLFLSYVRGIHIG